MILDSVAIANRTLPAATGTPDSTNTPFQEAMAFPALYPTGVGAYGDPCHLGILSRIQFVRTLLHSISHTRFQSSRTWPFAMLNIINRIQLHKV